MMMPIMKISCSTQGILRNVHSKLFVARTTTRINSRRHVQTFAEYQQWREEIRSSAIPASTLRLKSLPLPEGAPFLHSVSPMSEHLKLAASIVADDNSNDTDATTNALVVAKKNSPRESLLQCKFPLSTDELLRNSVADFSNWSSFRLGKFYEIVDALTADVAYRHAKSIHDDDDDDDDNSSDGHNDNGSVAFVTAGHYHSRKFERTRIHQDVIFRSYVTSVGRSSMEVRTDALQQCPDHPDKEILVNVCHTTMVALDSSTMKALSKVGRKLPPLVTETKDDEQRLALAQKHQEIRSQRSAQAMQLRSPVSMPPTFDEMKELHQLYVNLIRQKERPSSSSSSSSSSPTSANKVSLPAMISEYTFRSSTVIFPEQRNVHGKLFGGFVMEESQKLAQYAAVFFAKGKPVIPLGIDEAVFLQPIAIGDMVTFTARLVHSTETTCRVLVTVEVRDPTDAGRIPVRSNRLMFVFGAEHFGKGIVPQTYSEILMYLDAQRRHVVEGPTDEQVREILQESQSLAGDRDVLSCHDGKELL